MILRLALRNLTRNLRRTVLSMGSVIAGVAVLILGQGLISGLTENTLRAQIDTLSGHVVLRPKGYPTEGLQHPVDALFTLDEAMVAELDAVAPQWTGRTLFVPRAVAGVDSLRVRAISVDPVRDPDIFPRDTWRIRGSAPRSAADGLLVSQGVATLLQIDVGDRLVLQVRTTKGALNALDLPICGVFTAGNPVLDKFGVFLTADLGQQLIRNEDQRSHVALRLKRRERAEEVAATLRQRLGDQVEVFTWIDETRDMMAIQELRRRALSILVFALMGMSATGIANVILMAAYERIREIGTLRAMGMTRRGVVGLFVVEGAFIGVFGALVGALVGGSVIAYYQRWGIDLSGALDTAAGGNLPIAAMLYTQFSEMVVAGAMVFGVLVAVLASIYPARMASEMPPAEAVRAE